MVRKIYRAIIDRPIGYKDNFGNCYPINYGYIPDLFAGDGEEQDVYIISEKIREPLESFEGELIAVIHRQDEDADVVMFLYRDDYYNKDTELKGIAEIIIAKQRNGSQKLFLTPCLYFV